MLVIPSSITPSFPPSFIQFPMPAHSRCCKHLPTRLVSAYAAVSHSHFVGNCNDSEPRPQSRLALFAQLGKHPSQVERGRQWGTNVILNGALMANCSRSSIVCCPPSPIPFIVFVFPLWACAAPFSVVAFTHNQFQLLFNASPNRRLAN